VWKPFGTPAVKREYPATRTYSITVRHNFYPGDARFYTSLLKLACPFLVQYPVDVPTRAATIDYLDFGRVFLPDPLTSTGGNRVRYG
jgi:hypothetical protein